jgi:hypothetical protein
MSDNEYLTVGLTIRLKPDITGFVIAETPEALWKAVPWKMQQIEFHESNKKVYFKQVTLKRKRHTYQVTFYYEEK